MRSAQELSFDPKEKLSNLERLGYSLGGYGNGLVYSVINAFLLVYYVSVVGANAATAASIIAISKIFDGISDLIMGHVLDHTSSKWGKARPWIMRISLPLAICTILMFSVPNGLSNSMTIAYMFVTYNLVNTVCYTVAQVSLTSLNGLITINQYERGILGNYSMLFSTAATMTINTVLLQMIRLFGNGNQYDQRGWTISIAILMCLSLLTNMLCFSICKERVTDSNHSDRKNKVSLKSSFKSILTNKYWLIVVVVMFLLNIMMTTFFGSGLYFSKYVLNNSGVYSWVANALSIAQVAAMLFAPIILKKFSKRNIFMIGMVISAVGFLLTAFTSNISLIIVLSVVKGIGFAFAAAPMYGLLQDTITYGDWKDGFSIVGMGSAAASFCQKLGSGLGTAIFGWVLAWGKFDVAPDSPSAITSINIVFIWLPLICTILSLIILTFYDLDKKFDSIVTDLEERD